MPLPRNQILETKKASVPLLPTSKLLPLSTNSMPTKMKKKSITPIITGIRDAKGNNILHKPILKLHFHPDTIKSNIDALIDNAPDQNSLFLLEDIKTLTAWALAHLNLKNPNETKQN